MMAGLAPAVTGRVHRHKRLTLASLGVKSRWQEMAANEIPRPIKTMTNRRTRLDRATLAVLTKTNGSEWHHDCT